jgi:hypothetical protein
VAVAGPSLKYAGTDAKYIVTVANRGNAVADETTIAVELPAGSKYLGGVEGAAAGNGAVKVKIGSLSAGAERSFELLCQLNAAGVNRLAVEASTKSGSPATAAAETQVEAVADIKLVVNDPPGAAPVGSDIEYELQVMNRGTQAAQQVRIVMQFSEGMEPVEFSGGQAKIVPGQVVCEPLSVLEAGEQVIVKVKARADRAGTHQYRVEVTGLDPGTRAVSEGTSKFYADSGVQNSAAARTATRPSSRFGVQR